jgi:enamine deaminase RidA (YjgF/YER057c/UK114 family)
MAATKTHIFSGSIYEEMAGYARAVVVGDHIFVSGTVGVDFATGQLAEGADAQTLQALNTIEKALDEAGASLADIVRVRVYIPNPDDVMTVSGVLKEKIGSGYPANTTVCAPLAVPGALVEIESEAIRGCGTAS